MRVYVCVCVCVWICLCARSMSAVVAHFHLVDTNTVEKMHDGLASLRQKTWYVFVWLTCSWKWLMCFRVDATVSFTDVNQTRWREIVYLSHLLTKSARIDLRSNLLPVLHAFVSLLVSEKRDRGSRKYDPFHGATCVSGQQFHCKTGSCHANITTIWIKRGLKSI